MKMEYQILDNGTAVVLTRQPELVYDTLYIDFSGAPSDATAIFESNGDTIYRRLCGKTCSVSVDKLDGAVKVTIAVLDGSARPYKWACEELMAEKQSNGGTLISPNDNNLPQKVVKLELQMQELNRSFISLEEKYKLLEDKLEKILEGYDLT